MARVTNLSLLKRLNCDRSRIMRYSRVEALKDMGRPGVERLREGRVFIVGCGALGSLCAMYLAAGGVGMVGIADFDTIDISNLQRQLFFGEDVLGKKKCLILAERMRTINSECKVCNYDELITKNRAENIFPDYDFVIDGSDNPKTKLQTASVCESLGIPYCIGGVREYSGQVMSWAPGHTGYSELFGDVLACSGITPCSIGGVLGPAAGVTASVQASEAIKYLSGVGEMLYDKLYNFDLKNSQSIVLG